MTPLAYCVSRSCYCAVPKVRSDTEILRSVGYQSNFIPLFCEPVTIADVKHISAQDQKTITSSLRQAVPSSGTEVSIESNNFASIIFYYLARWVKLFRG